MGSEIGTVPSAAKKAKRERADPPPPYLPELPSELVGKIVGMAHLPYNRGLMDSVGLNRDQRAYANLALRQVEEEWSPTIQVVKETLIRLQTHLFELEGGSNRFQPHDGTHAVRLMACWPRHWVFEDVTDANDLRSEIADASGSTMDADMCKAVADTLEYCYSTPADHDGHEQDAKKLTVFVPQDRLHPTVTSAWMSFDEALVDHYENYHGDVDTLSRKFCLAVRFVGGEQYNISVYPEHSSHPGHYIISPEWVSTKRYGADNVPVREDREKKGPLGPHASAVSLIVRQLLLMEQARPFMYFSVGQYLCREWRAELISAGVHRLGVPGLRVE